MLAKLKEHSGVTLVELLVALTLVGIVTGAIYNVYILHNKSYAVQDRVVDMQRNFRSALNMLSSDIRMAGYNRLRVAGIGFLSASANQLQFTMDITGGDGDGLDNDMDGVTDENGESDGDALDVNENITYQLSGSNLLRNAKVIAGNIDALNFVYLDASGSPTANLADIRTVQITLVARTDFVDRDYTNNNVYQNQNPTGPETIYTAPGDNFRRKRITLEVKCRNLWSS